MKTPCFVSRKNIILAIALLLLPIGQTLAADILVDADCSLANAIRSANGADMVEPMIDCEAGDGVDANSDQADDETIPGLDTITIDVSGTDEGLIALDATLFVTSNIVIEGKGFSINGGGNQIFNVNTGSLTINDLNMSNGFGIENGGAIAVAGGTLALNNSVVSQSGARGYGGGIYANASDVTLTDSVVSGNATGASAEDYPPVEVEDEADQEGESRTIGTEADAQAEGIETEAQAEQEPTETLEEEVALPEVDGVNGGGIYFAGDSSNLVIERSGVDSNSSPADGGGVYIDGGSASISNSTFSDNSAGGFGGGIYNAGSSIITHATVVGNTAVEGGGIYDLTVLQLYNSILSFNVGGDCAGTLNANLGNLIEDDSCNHDGLTADPLLLQLGGSPVYYMPQEGSPVIDSAFAENCSPLDQRGIERLPEACDIGAAEYQSGVFSFQIQSALAALTPGGDGGSSADDDEEEAAPTPVESSCDELPGHITVAGASSSVYCKMLDWSGVGNQTLVNHGALYAIDIYGWVPTPLTVCFQHDSGAIVLLDAAYSPRIIVPLQTWPQGSFQCASVDRAGSAVYMPLAFLTSGAIAEPIWSLSEECTVTTTDILNLRQGPTSSSPILANVLNDVELAADQRATHFYRVNYFGIIGWLSSDYLTLKGSCY